MGCLRARHDLLCSTQQLCDDTVASTGQTLAPGLYKSTAAMTVTRDLTLDAKGDEDAVWIFQMASTFTSGANKKIILKNEAQAGNVFWQV